MQYFENFQSFAEANKDKVFRFWVFRKWPAGGDEYDPAEEFADDQCSFGKIQSVTKLSDFDYLVGLKLVEDGDDTDYIEYYKLDEIRLVYTDYDKEPKEDD